MDEIRRMFEWIENHSELGRVDICVANAGYAGKGHSLIEGLAI